MYGGQRAEKGSGEEDSQLLRGRQKPGAGGAHPPGQWLEKVLGTGRRGLRQLPGSAHCPSLTTVSSSTTTAAWAVALATVLTPEVAWAGRGSPRAVLKGPPAAITPGPVPCPCQGCPLLSQEEFLRAGPVPWCCPPAGVMPSMGWFCVIFCIYFSASCFLGLRVPSSDGALLRQGLAREITNDTRKGRSGFIFKPQALSETVLPSIIPSLGRSFCCASHAGPLLGVRWP